MRPVYWIAAILIFGGWGLLEWQDADTECRIAALDQQHVAEAGR